ncbi:MAG: porin [Deltaproteobacteria bacterium]|nr:porin [Deltaproteobacteria bacterium]
MRKLFVLGMAALLLVAFAVPAMADVKIGGIIFTDFYYLDRDTANSTWRGYGGDSFTQTAIQVPNITRLYGRWTNEDNVGMYIEFGLGQGTGNTINSSSDNDFSAVVRHAYGWWDVNPMFTIMAGHSTTPFSPLNPSQLIGTRSGSVNIIGVGYGDFYSGRFAQVRGTFKFGKAARLEIALVDPNGTLAGGSYGPWTGQGGEAVGYQTNTKIPRIDISVPIYLGPVHLYPGFLYQHRTVDRLGTAYAGVDNSIDTWIGTLGAKLGLGPFGLSGEFNYGENWGNTRGLAGTSPSIIGGMASATLKNNGQIHDAETYSFWVELSYKFGPITPSLMYGQQKSENETAAGVDRDIRTQMWGISVPIDLAKGFRVRPELMWYDDGDDLGVDYGKYAIYGVQFQITF